MAIILFCPKFWRKISTTPHGRNLKKQQSLAAEKFGCTLEGCGSSHNYCQTHHFQKAVFLKCLLSHFHSQCFQHLWIEEGFQKGLVLMGSFSVLVYTVGIAILRN